MAWVKICGLTRLADAEKAIEEGADALGFVHEPSSPRYIQESDLEWILALPDTVEIYSVFGPYDPYEYGEIARVQSSDFVQPGQIFTYRLNDSILIPDEVGMVLLEPHVEGQYGGTGQRVDWDQAAEFVQKTHHKVILAGGLTPENVAEAIARVKPFGVDVSSGIETSPGIKDHGKLKAFIQAARGL